MAIPKHGQVVAVREESPDAHWVEVETAEPLGFQGGQYVIVDSGKLRENGKPAKRAYSILSADRNQRRIEFAVQRLPGKICSGYMAQLALEMRKAESLQMPLCVVIMDIDNFKTFNDTYGHLAGDDALRTLGEVIRACVRDKDIACRYGGEEFSIILPGTRLPEAAEAADRIRLRFREYRRNEINSHGAESLSAGIAAWREHDTPDGFLKRADDALYEAKNQGKNRVMTSAADGATDAQIDDA